MGGISGGENCVSLGTISYGASKEIFLVHIVELKPMIKARFSGKLVSSSVSDVVVASVHPEKTYLKKLMKMKMMMMIIITNK